MRRAIVDSHEILYKFEVEELVIHLALLAALSEQIRCHGCGDYYHRNEQCVETGMRRENRQFQ